jgi:hypothetical protein
MRVSKRLEGSATRNPRTLDPRAGCGMIERGAPLVHESLFGRPAQEDPSSRGQGDAQERGR